MANYLYISDAAKEVKVESHVLRYWEEELHLPIKRNELGHRYYTEEDVERFKEIKGMKERGLQLKAIKMILKDGRLDVLPIEDEKEQTKPVESRTEKLAGDRGGAAEGRAEKLAGDRGGAVEGRPESTAGDRGSTAEARAEVRGEGPAGGAGNRGNAANDRSESLAPAGAGQQGMAIDIIAHRELEAESREEKSRRLQWLLQQLIRETLQENNEELCREIKESVVKELDYQFRMQEEREEARDKMLAQRDEEHFKKMDELLRKKAKRNGSGLHIEKKPKAEKKEPEKEEQQPISINKKKRRFLL